MDLTAAIRSLILPLADPNLIGHGHRFVCVIGAIAQDPTFNPQTTGVAGGSVMAGVRDARECFRTASHCSTFLMPPTARVRFRDSRGPFPRDDTAPRGTRGSGEAHGRGAAARGTRVMSRAHRLGHVMRRPVAMRRVCHGSGQHGKHDFRATGVSPGQSCNASGRVGRCRAGPTWARAVIPRRPATVNPRLTIRGHCRRGSAGTPARMVGHEAEVPVRRARCPLWRAIGRGRCDWAGSEVRAVTGGT